MLIVSPAHKGIGRWGQHLLPKVFLLRQTSTKEIHMKKHTLLLLVVGLFSLMIVGQVHSDTRTVRRVTLQATDTIDFAPDTLLVAAEGTGGVGGAGTDLTVQAEGNYCDIHFNKVSINEDANEAVLIGKVIEASDPNNYGAFVKITAHTNGKVNFVFQPINGPISGSTGAAGIDLTGTVKIKVLP